MKLLIAYATTEGQTRKVARFVAGRLLDAGHSVELVNTEGGAAVVDPADFSGAILAASIHNGRLQQSFQEFVRHHRSALNAVPTLFLPVSLSAAGEAEDRAQIAALVDTLCSALEWSPTHVEHVAGAFRFEEYDFFKAWAMRWIAHRKDKTLTPGEDREYTDWAALGTAIDRWAATIPSR